MSMEDGKLGFEGWGWLTVLVGAIAGKTGLLKNFDGGPTAEQQERYFAKHPEQRPGYSGPKPGSTIETIDLSTGEVSSMPIAAKTEAVSTGMKILDGSNSISTATPPILPSKGNQIS